MYPFVSDLLPDFLGIPWPFPFNLNSFGLMVATAFLVAAWLTKKELDRLYNRGLIAPVRATYTDEKGREKTGPTSPSFYVWTLMGIGVVAGIVGSRLFNIIDFWDEFVQNPVEVIFSGAGLTFYGGLIMATLAVWWFARRKSIELPRLSDAASPGLMVAYGIGRIGCYLSGDGDWGLCSSLADKPAWVPGFLWTETFPRAYVFGGGIQDPVTFNRVARGIECDIPGAVGVYPTMLYETVATVLLGGLLWAMRKHPFKAGWLFSVYLIFTGAERFLIEFMRTNKVWALGLSQSQWISIGLITLGAIGVALLTRRITFPPEADTPGAKAKAASGATVTSGAA